LCQEFQQREQGAPDFLSLSVLFSTKSSGISST
jgi:hypothetical protein